MLVKTNKENAFREIFWQYRKNKGPRIKAMAPERTNSRDIGFQTVKSSLDMTALIGEKRRTEKKKGAAPQAPRYTNIDKLLKAKTLKEIWPI